jgi:site-specific DNA-methyltransferase (adenine-specific)
MFSPYYSADRITLYHGDALAVLLEMPDASVDAIITDPPYSSGGTYRGDRAGMSTASKYLGDGRPAPLPDFGGDNRDQRGYAYWCTLWLTQCLRVAKPGAVLTVSTDWRQLPTVTDVVQAGGWTWRGILAWAKPDPRPQFGRYRSACEFIVWATNGHRPMEGDCLPGWWFVSTPRQRNHQTEKPLEVYRDLVKACPPDGVVFDPFAGSGTAGVAALAEGRRFIGIEMTEAYVDVALGRLRAAAGMAGSRDSQDALQLFGEGVA